MPETMTKGNKTKDFRRLNSGQLAIRIYKIES